MPYAAANTLLRRRVSLIDAAEAAALSLTAETTENSTVFDSDTAAARIAATPAGRLWSYRNNQWSVGCVGYYTHADFTDGTTSVALTLPFTPPADAVVLLSVQEVSGTPPSRSSHYVLSGNTLTIHLNAAPTGTNVIRVHAFVM